MTGPSGPGLSSAAGETAPGETPGRLRAGASGGGGARRIASWALPFVSSLAILWFMYRDISLSSLAEGLSGIDPGWAAAYVVLSAIEPIVRGARWNVLIGARNRPGSVKAVFMAKATNNVLPFRAGDAIRAQYSRDVLGAPYSRSAAALLAEMAVDVFLLCLLGLGFAALSSHGDGRILAICAAGAFLTAAALVFTSRCCRKEPGRTQGRLRALAGKVGRHVSSIFSGPGGRSALAWSLAIWAHAVVTTYCGLRMCLPSVSAEGAVACIVFVYLSVVVPSAPGFVGTYHAAVAGSMAVMGYGLRQYPLAPLLIHILQLVPQTGIGLAAGLRYVATNDWRASVSQLRAIRASLREGDD